MAHLSDSRFYPPRRSFLLAIAAGAGCLATGCLTPAVRSNLENAELPLEDSKTQLIGDVAGLWGLNFEVVEAVAMVSGLPDTGSDPPPSPERSALFAEMQTRKVRYPNQVLASPSTALVMVRALIPPGAQKGDRIDVEVWTPPRSETTSLRGGWLMPARLEQTAKIGNAVATGHTLANAQGAVLVDAVFAETADSVSETRGRVLGGAVVLKSRPIGLVLREGSHSIKLSRRVAAAVNERFHRYDRHGSKTGVTTPKTDEYIELEIHPRYKRNISRYMQVVRSIAINEPAHERTRRLAALERALLEPTTAALAAVRLEAIGKGSVDTLRRGVSAEDNQVRYSAALALAYLDEAEAAPLLASAAADPAFRYEALLALSSMDHVVAYEALSDLLHHESVETRYGAFQALRERNPEDPQLKGELLADAFRLHVLPTSGKPLVHFTRSTRPEILLLGHDLELRTPCLLEAESVMIRSLDRGRVRVSRFAAGQPDRTSECDARLADVLRAAVEVGADYPTLLKIVEQARGGELLEARLAIDAVPRPRRRVVENGEEERVASRAAEAGASGSSLAEEDETSPQDSGGAEAPRSMRERDAAAADSTTPGWTSTIRGWFYR